MKGKKKTILACMLLALVLAVLTGCGGKGPSGDTDKAAEAAYIDFLNGKGEVTVSEGFKRDNVTYDLGINEEKYTYAALRAAVKESEGTDSSAQYCFIELTGDKVNEMLLRFNAENDILFNWTGVFTYKDGTIFLTAFYEDGGRVFSEFYDTGYLRTGGSSGAGAYGYTLYGFTDDARLSPVFSENTYYGNFAVIAAYDLTSNQQGLKDNYDDISYSMLCMREYIRDGEVKISVSDWSEDSAVRARENEMINDLIGLGAEMINEEKMDEYTSLKGYESSEVIWIDIK